MIKNGRSCNEIFIRQGGMQTFSALRLAFAVCSMCLMFEIAQEQYLVQFVRLKLSTFNFNNIKNMF